jgi:hypothetical protein
MPVPALLASMLNSVVGSAVNTAMENSVYTQPTPTELGVIGARAFPEGTKKGEMEPLQGMMEVTISGKAYARAPGMQIRNQQNLIIMPGSIQATVPVRYQLDPMGSVFRVWVLTRNEIATP